jgi:hypothetical protein
MVVLHVVYWLRQLFQTSALKATFAGVGDTCSLFAENVSEAWPVIGVVGLSPWGCVTCKLLHFGKSIRWFLAADFSSTTLLQKTSLFVR